MVPCPCLSVLYPCVCHVGLCIHWAHVSIKIIIFGRQNLKVEGDQTDLSMQSATGDVCLQAFGTHNLQPANNKQTCE